MLRRGVDAGKDQSYFLFSLTQDAAGVRACSRSAICPKDEVREYARRRGLPVADKPDSQEICFIPDNDYRSFVTQERARTRRATARSSTSRAACSAATPASTASRSASARGSACSVSPTGAPLYVLALRPADQQVVVGPKASLERTRLTASGVNWIAEEPAGALRVAAQIRHHHQAAPAAVRSLGDGRAEVVFDAPQLAITPGQAVVFYDGDASSAGAGSTRRRRETAESAKHAETNVLLCDLCDLRG